VQVIAQASVTDAPAGGKAAFMSTSFQIGGSWDVTELKDIGKSINLLTSMGMQHMNVQLIGSAMPQTAANAWDFTTADGLIQPVLAQADKSPLLEIGTSPAFLSDANGDYLEANLPQYAEYCANLVRYYNTGGFTVNGTLYKSPSSTPITWWGIHNEANINNVTPAQYVTMYNAIVKAMRLSIRRSRL
jgi:hypothetical protein